MTTPEEKIMTLDQAVAWQDTIKAQGQRLVVTNGVFDLLHLGHVQYLQEAASHGDRLLVAINSDASVKAIKGPSRPVVTEYDRAYILACLQFIDAVVIFNGPKPVPVFEKIHPDVYVKGGDYTIDSLDREEYALLMTANPEFVFIPLVAGHSTSSTIRKLRGAETPASTETSQNADLPAGVTDPRLSFLYTRRSVRAYQPRPVSDEDIKKVLSGAMAGPTAMAKECWRFIVLKDQSLRQQIATVLPRGKILADAPAGIILCGDQNAVLNSDFNYMMQDTCAAMENLLLAASALGLGACWLGVQPNQDRIDGISAILNLPQNIVPIAAVSLGWPAQDTPPRTRYKDEYITWR